MNRSPIISWDTTSRADWDKAHAAAGAPYQQDWAYGEAIKAANPEVRLMRAEVRSSDGALIAHAQILSRPVGMIVRFAACTLGPIWTGDLEPHVKRATYRALRRTVPLSCPKLLLFTPDEEATPASGLKGFRKVMTGDATILLDLSQDEAALRAGLEGKWRNTLGKAEKSAIKVQRGGVKPAQYRWLLEAETQQRRSRGYRALPPQLVEAWQTHKTAGAQGDKSAGVAVFRADLGRDACAGMLFLLHGDRATYHIGWTNEAGRANAAHNLLLWTAILDLKSRGLRLLDLGGVNTQSGAGIARFKIGSGGRVFQRAGSFI